MTYILDLQKTDEDRALSIQASTLSLFFCASSTLSFTYC